MAKRDYYKIMNVRPIDKENDIKKSYKELAKKYHPDLNPNTKTWAEEKMKELTEAYDFLMDKQKRAEYDNSTWFKPRVPKELKRYTPEQASFKASLTQKKERSFWDKLKKLMFVMPEDEGNKELTPQAMARFSMVLTYINRSDQEALEMAKVEFTAILKDAPQNPDALYNMGLIEYKLGNFENALRHFSQAQRHLGKDQNVKKILELLKEDV